MITSKPMRKKKKKTNQKETIPSFARNVATQGELAPNNRTSKWIRANPSNTLGGGASSATSCVSFLLYTISIIQDD